MVRMKQATRGSFFLYSVIFIFSRVCNCVPSDTLKPGEVLEQNQTLVSANGVFELGFFSSDGSSSNNYLGIWFNDDPSKKAVWVANRDNPTLIINSSSTLSISQEGNIVIYDARKHPIIVNSDRLSTTNNNTIAKLLDSGNFILVERGENIAWQSFYYPTDTFLPGMKLGLFDMDTNLQQRILVSWLSDLTPAIGPFTLGLDRSNKSKFDIWFNQRELQHIGFWDGHSFKFAFQITHGVYNFSFVSNNEEISVTFNPNGKKISWFTMTPQGGINEYILEDHRIEMVSTYAPCEGVSFVYSDVCLMPKPTKCGKKDTFLPIKGSLPNPAVVNGSMNMGRSECGIKCSYNCSCIAYTLVREDDTGCELYYGNKKDLQRNIGKGDGIVYVRGDALGKSGFDRKKLLLALLSVLVTLLVGAAASMFCYLRGRYDNRIGSKTEASLGGSTAQMLSHFGSKGNSFEFGKRKNHETPLLNFSCIVAATDNFTSSRKIGEGGFGPVYKGTLLGHEVAVKRLSRASGQGLEEFKTEIRLISNLQHSNLVRLLGFCIQGEEKILIYEYMPNGSLDYFLFDDKAKKESLDWRSRVHIIEGIAQGILYLHKYSRVKIIHRDLKTSNILLDSHMNPKISDFGLAKIFDEHSKTKTRRVCGTYGYMSPEYALQGLYSTKSDVFSFGVIILEIISGRRSTCFYEAEQCLDFLGYAWDMWKDGLSEEFMDPTLADTYLVEELLLCFQVGLLCIQDNARDRPAMADVVSMLSNERTNLPVPKQSARVTHSGAIVTHSGAIDATYSGIIGR